MNGYLLDTNVVLELVKPAPDANVVDWVENADESGLFLSVLTLGEIRNGIEKLRDGRRRARLETWLQVDLRSRFEHRLLPINEAVADRWGTISAIAANNGRPLPLVDGLLAATALEHNLTFVTRDDSAVAATAVSTLNPWL